jgi:hypothetical protein
MLKDLTMQVGTYGLCNIVVHVFQNKLENITTSKLWEMQKYHNS